MYFAHLVAPLGCQIPIFIISQHCLFCGQSQVWVKPFNRIDIQHPLQRTEVNSNLDSIQFANLNNRLNTRPLHQLLHQRFVLSRYRTVLLEWVSSLSINVLMHPSKSCLFLRQYVHFVIGTCLIVLPTLLL